MWIGQMQVQASLGRGNLSEVRNERAVFWSVEMGERAVKSHN